MIIVTGKVEIKDGHIEEALRHSQEHVLRSRKEPGCIWHSALIDSENANQIIFNERWENKETLLAHFVVPEALAFVDVLNSLSVGEGEMKMYEASELTMADLTA